jgi:hypothetical protein
VSLVGVNFFVLNHLQKPPSFIKLVPEFAGLIFQEVDVLLQRLCIVSDRFRLCCPALHAYKLSLVLKCKLGFVVQLWFVEDAWHRFKKFWLLGAGCLRNWCAFGSKFAGILRRYFSRLYHILELFVGQVFWVDHWLCSQRRKLLVVSYISIFVFTLRILSIAATCFLVCKGLVSSLNSLQSTSFISQNKTYSC